jgi:hypothetical protein
MSAKSFPWALSTYLKKSNLAPIFGDSSQSEKLSEVKPPLLMLAPPDFHNFLRPSDPVVEACVWFPSIDEKQVSLS